MNINNCLQAKFNNLIDANKWVDKKIQSKKWVHGKITTGIVQAPGGENVLMYFASVQNSRPPMCPYTNKPNGKTLFSK
jgi:hypothetical protein